MMRLAEAVCIVEVSQVVVRMAGIHELAAAPSRRALGGRKEIGRDEVFPPKALITMTMYIL